MVELKTFWLDKGDYFQGKILLKFHLLSTLHVLQKVVYVIRQNKDNQSPLSGCFAQFKAFLFSRIFSLAKLTLYAHLNGGYSKFLNYKEK